MGRKALSAVRESLWDDLEGSGGPSGGLGEVGIPSRRSWMGREADMEVREALPEVPEMPLEIREIHQVVWERSESPPGSPSGKRLPTQRSGTGREAISEVRVIGRPSWRSGRGREAHLEYREGSVGPPGGPLGVGSSLLEVQEGL